MDPVHLTEDLRDLRIGADAVSWYRGEIHRYGEMIREALRAREGEGKSVRAANDERTRRCDLGSLRTRIRGDVVFVTGVAFRAHRGVIMKMRTACLAAPSGAGADVLHSIESRGSPDPECRDRHWNAAASAPAKSETKASIGPARFPHEKHFDELEIECVTCHHETNAKPLSFPHPRLLDDFWVDCSTCHAQGRARPRRRRPARPVTTCRTATSGDETLSAKVVIHKNCWSCHEVGTGASASTSCKSCHTPGS